MQVPAIREDGLQLDEHRRFQTTFWRMQRFVWGLFAIVLVLALSGLTGAGGYLSRDTLVLRNGEVDFPRIGRWEASDDIRVRFDAGGGSHSLQFGSAFHDGFEIEAVHPEPQRMFASPAGTTLEIGAEGGSPVQVVVHVRPLRPGVLRYAVQLDGVAGEIRSVVLP